MNESYARHAIQAHLVSIADTIVSGITVQGSVEREISEIAISRFASPRTYPFCAVVCSRAFQFNSAGAMLHPKSRYQMEIIFEDEALIQADDTTQFETMDDDFRVMCDRIINSLTTTGRFTYGGSTFVLLTDDDNFIVKENMDGFMASAQDTIEALIFGATISFEVEEC
jgi:hypothetical protein